MEKAEPSSETFAEPAAADEHSLAGADGARATALLANAQRDGAEVFANACESAVRRLLASGDPLGQGVLFDDGELAEIADALARVIATADLLGRTRVRRRAERAAVASEGFAEESGWSRIDGGKWKSAGGRVVSDATYQKFRGAGVAPRATPYERVRAEGTAAKKKLQAAVEEQRALADRLDREGRDPTPEERSRYDAAGQAYDAEKVRGRRLPELAIAAAALDHVARTDDGVRTTFRLAAPDGTAGELVLTREDGAARNVARLAGAAWAPGDRVWRTNTIEVGASGRGKGYGQALYLAAHATGDWLYNSQAEPGAVRALDALKRKGLIELYWHGTELGGVHASRLTAKGRQLLDDADGPEADELLPKAQQSLFGRARKWLGFAEGDDDPFHDFAEPVPSLAPDAAVAYFQRLTPTLGTNVVRYGPRLDRHTFTLAVASDQVILDRVKAAILREIQGSGAGTPDVQTILDAAGVSHRNPQYAEMVVRTNVLSSLNEGQTAELQEPEMQDAFPVWLYDGIRDGREGDDHRPKFDRYYPSSVAFAEVRGPRVWNCRCGHTPIHKSMWESLQRTGTRVEETW